MAANINPIYPLTVRSAVASFANADGTTAKAIYTPTGSNGARIDKILATNTDTNSYTFNFFIRVSGTNYLIGTYTIPASSGNASGTAPADILVAITNFILDPYGNRIMYLDSNSALWGASTGTITAAKTVSFITFGGEY